LPNRILLNAFDQWSTRSSNAVEALRLRSTLVGGRLGGTGYDVSIVASPPDQPPEVALVYWQSPDLHLGRKVDLDDDSRAKWPTAAVYPLFNFASWRVVAPLGYTLHKTRELRRPVPTNFLRIRDMWQCAMSAAAGEPVVHICWGCELDDAHAAVHECAVCLCSWHTACVDEISESRAEAISRRPPPPAELTVPATISAHMCKLCSQWLAHIPTSPD
jgi:hypothetical protein